MSGGHFNPGVSLAMFLDKRLELPHMIGYWIFQLAGAVLGSLCVLIAFNQNAVALTATLPGPSGAGTALFLELLATAIFVLVILHSTAGERHAGTALVAIPLTLVAAHLALIPFSGSSLNTARSFGPALIGSEWTDFWVYIVGPIGGAIIGWLVYSIIVVGGKPAEAPPATGSATGPAGRLAGGSLEDRFDPLGLAAHVVALGRGARRRVRARERRCRGEPARDRVDVERIDENARLLGDELRRAADVRRDDRAAHGHRLEQRLTERLDEAGLADDARRRHVLSHLVVRDGAHEPHAAPAGERRP